MGHHKVGGTLLSLARSFKRLDLSDPLTQCLAPRLTRTFASHTHLPPLDIITESPEHAINPNVDPTLYKPAKVLTTVHSWPDLKPLQYAWYNSNLLDVPMRRDLLHRAVIFEADATRHGSAWMPHRKDMPGSNRKVSPQKGTGRARAGDSKSPIRHGGGRAFGPKPRDFSTELQRKIYDRAWRIALSYRYRLGQLVVVDGPITLQETQTARFIQKFFESNKWDRSLLVTEAVDVDAADSKDLLVAQKARERRHLLKAISQVGRNAMLKDEDDVDVKNLLSTGRIIIEMDVLNRLLQDHASDLGNNAHGEPISSSLPELDLDLQIEKTEANLDR